MLGVASLADYLRNFQVNHAGDGVVQKQAAARALIVDQVAQTLLVLAHRNSFASAATSQLLRANYNVPGKKQSQVNGAGSSEWPKHARSPGQPR